jgi:hypothetical protein
VVCAEDVGGAEPKHPGGESIAEEADLLDVDNWDDVPLGSAPQQAPPGPATGEAYPQQHVQPVNLFQNSQQPYPGQVANPMQPYPPHVANPTQQYPAQVVNPMQPYPVQQNPLQQPYPAQPIQSQQPYPPQQNQPPHSAYITAIVPVAGAPQSYPGAPQMPTNQQQNPFSQQPGYPAAQPQYPQYGQAPW